jgi:hypothetical protein
MAPRPAILLTLAAALAAAAGCGSDAVKKDIERMRATCATLTGKTVAESSTALQGQGQISISASCSTTLGPLGSADQCPGAPGPYTSPICLVGFEVCALGTSACSTGPFGGCAFACILRVAATTPDQVTASSTVCATEFVSSQSVTPVSGLPCR